MQIERHRRIGSGLIVAGTMIALASAMPASAAESVNYTYDSLGRLRQSVTSGSINNGLSEVTVYDSSDNRNSYVMSGSPLSMPPFPVVVVPLNGLTVIPLPYPVQ